MSLLKRKRTCLDSAFRASVLQPLPAAPATHYLPVYTLCFGPPEFILVPPMEDGFSPLSVSLLLPGIPGAFLIPVWPVPKHTLSLNTQWVWI